MIIGPSPDWVVGVSGLDLCQKDCTWTENKVIDLFPYDAGTDNGITYMVCTIYNKYVVIFYNSCVKILIPIRSLQIQKQFLEKKCIGSRLCILRIQGPLFTIPLAIA